jgi:cysteine desulfurase
MNPSLGLLFPLGAVMNKTIYVDYAAATPVDARVLEAMLPYFGDTFYNPSAQYASARKVAKDLQDARAKVAQIIGSRPSEIIFTAGGTEANNLAIHGVMRMYPGASMAVLSIEHDAVLRPSEEYDYREVTVHEDGRVNLDSLKAAVDDNTVLVSIMYANNEIGTVQPLKQIAATIEEIKRERHKRNNHLPLYFHTDASQAANYLDMHVSRLGVDIMTINGGKMYGPKQSGALYVKSSVRLQPLLTGGGQERGLRSGTENVAGSIGFAEAFELATKMRKEESARLQKLQNVCIELLRKEIPNATINGSLKFRLPNNIHITIPDVDNERLLVELDERGIMCAAGSACSASSEEASHVIKAIGMDVASARSSLRFSMGRETTAENIKTVVAALKELIQK